MGFFHRFKLFDFEITYILVKFNFMKNIFFKLGFILIFSSILFGCGSPTTIEINKENRHYFTEKKKIVSFKGVPFSGTKIKKYDNGQLKFEEHFLDGKYSGTWESYYENGQLKERKSFRDGGEYYENGKLKNRIGSYESYYDNGNINYKGEYNENGEKEGIWINGSRDGSNFKQEYQDGDFIKNIK